MTIINEMPESMRKTIARMDAQERAKTRRTMNHLEELALDEWDCIGLSPLMYLFGPLIAAQVRLEQVHGSRHQKVIPDVLAVIARWAEWHSTEYGDPENQHVAEALDAVKQAAVHARRTVTDFEAEKPAA
jgi:hypothetical protein